MNKYLYAIYLGRVEKLTITKQTEKQIKATAKNSTWEKLFRKQQDGSFYREYHVFLGLDLTEQQILDAVNKHFDNELSKIEKKRQEAISRLEGL